MKEIKNMNEFKDEFKLVKIEAYKAYQRNHDRMMGFLPDDENDDVGYYIHRHESFPYTSIGWGEISVPSKELLEEFIDWININRWEPVNEWVDVPVKNKRKLRL